MDEISYCTCLLGRKSYLTQWDLLMMTKQAQVLVAGCITSGIPYLFLSLGYTNKGQLALEWKATVGVP